MSSDTMTNDVSEDASARYGDTGPGASPAQPEAAPTASATSQAAAPAAAQRPSEAHSIYGIQPDHQDSALGEFADTMHALGVPADVGRAAFQWLDSNESDEAYAGQDAADRAKSIDHLRKLWPGDEFEQNIAAANRYLINNLPAGVGNILTNVRIGGTRLLNAPTAIVKLVAIAKEGATVAEPTGNVDADIQAIEKVMRTDYDAYRRDAGLQVRLLSLYAQRLNQQAPTQ